VVTGYQGGEVNSVDGFWTVRQSDAHAWAEVWEDGTGWVRVDPTGAVSPGRIGTFQRLQAPQGVIATALVTLSPDLLARLRAELGSREQQLEPVGAELHPEQAAEPAEEPGF
jgi:hypothetical protein